MGSYPDLAARAKVIAYDLRDAKRAGLMKQRLEVWASLPGVGSDETTAMRAIIGACVAIESWLKVRLGRPARHADRDRDVPFSPPLFSVRNRLPIMHPKKTNPATLDDLVRDRTQGKYDTAADMLSDMAHQCPPDPVHDGVSLVDPWRELRKTIGKLRGSEHVRLSAAGAGPS